MMVGEGESHSDDARGNPSSVRDAIETQIAINQFVINKLKMEQITVQKRLRLDQQIIVYCAALVVSCAFGVIVSLYKPPAIGQTIFFVMLFVVAAGSAAVASFAYIFGVRRHLARLEACEDSISENQFALILLEKRLKKASEYG